MIKNIALVVISITLMVQAFANIEASAMLRKERVAMRIAGAQLEDDAKAMDRQNEAMKQADEAMMAAQSTMRDQSKTLELCAARLRR